MWPILLCSVLSIAIIIDRLYVFYKSKTRLPNLVLRVKLLCKESRYEEALLLCEKTPGAVPHLLAIGLHVRNRTEEEKEKLISRAGSKIVRHLDKHLRGLAIIGNVTPLLGLMGTVTGMIKAFMKIQELGGRVDPSLLAGGIWEALVTTVAGLGVAIPTMVVCHYLEGKVEEIAVQMKDAAAEILGV